MPLVYSYKASRDCYVVSGQNYTEPSVNGIPTVYNDGVNGTKDVKEIADFGFYRSNIGLAIIPSGIDYIGRSAFEECIFMENLFILDAPLTIGERAFASCYNLTGFFLGNAIKKVEKSGVYESFRIKSLNLPDSLTGIEDYGFAQISQASGFNMPKNIKKIGNYAFFECAYLSPNPYLYIPETLEYLGSGAFGRCFLGIKEVRFGSTKIDKILEQTFANNQNLRYIYFHTGLKEIHTKAFFNNQRLQNVYLPSGTTFIGHSHFNLCHRLSYANIPSGTGIKIIPENCFNGCKALQRVDFGDNIIEIGNGAFAGCWSLGYTGQTGAQENLALDILGANIQYERSLYWTGFGEIQNVKLITGNIGTGNNDLLTITGLYYKNFYLPTGLQILGAGAISSARVEKILTIPKNLSVPLTSDLNSPLNLESFEVHPDNLNLSAHSGLLYNKTKTALIACPYARTGEINIPDTVINIGSSAFANTAFLSYIRVPDNVKQIGSNSFASSAITGIVLPNQLSSVGSSAFSRANLKTIDFSKCNLLNDLGQNAFSECINLTGITLSTGNNFKLIRSNTFNNCQQLLELSIPDNIQHLSYPILNFNYALQRVNFGTGINYKANPSDIYQFNSEFCANVESNFWLGTQFSDAGVLSGIFVKENHPSLRTINNVLYTKNSGILVTYPFYLSIVSGFNNPPYNTFFVPNHVTGISERAFSNSFIRNYFLGYNVKEIKTEAFRRHVFLTGITISNGDVKDYIFGMSPNLSVKNINFGSTGEITLRDYALGYCLGLEKINIPSGVNLFNSTALYNSINLSEINVDPANPFMSSIDGVLYNKNQDNMIIFPPQKSGSLTLSDNLTGIGSALRTSKINYLKFGKGITRLPTDTVYLTDFLTGIDLGEYITGLEPFSIRSCPSLKKIYFGSGISHFYFYKFIPGQSLPAYGEPIHDCPPLEEIIYPNKLFTAISNGFISSGRDLRLISIQTPFPWLTYTGIFGPGVFGFWNGKPRTVIRYTPLNDQECIVNHIDFQFSDTLPVPFSSGFGRWREEYTGWLTGQIPETLYGRKVISLSGLNNITGIFGQNDNFTKFLYIPSGIEIKNSYLQSLKISGLKKLEKIIVHPINPYYASENDILYTKNKRDIMAVPIKYYDSGFCVEENVTGIYGEAFAYNENINNITFKGNAPQIGQNIFTGANPNLKIYRKKYAKGFGEYLEDRKLYYRSDNIILTNGPSNKFNIFTGENGKMTTFYTC